MHTSFPRVCARVLCVVDTNWLVVVGIFSFTMPRHTCEICNKSFDRRTRLQNHVASAHTDSFACQICAKKCRDVHLLAVHVASHKKLTCQVCKRQFARPDTLLRHARHAHPTTAVQQQPTGISPPRGKHQCPRCEYSSFSKKRWKRHVTSKHPGGRTCDLCTCCFYDSASYIAHRPDCRRQNGDRPKEFKCTFCGASFELRLLRERHQNSCVARRDALRRRGVGLVGGGVPQPADPGPASQAGTPPPPPQSPRPGPSRERDASPRAPTPPPFQPDAGLWDWTFSLRGDALVYSYPVTHDNFDLGACLITHKNMLVEKLKSLLSGSKGLRWWLVARVEATREKSVEGGGTALELEQHDLPLRSVALTLRPVEERVEEQMESAILQLVHSSEHLAVEGSGWAITRVFSLEINSGELDPLMGTGGRFIPTPEFLRNSKKGLLNIQSGDSGECFRLSVIAGLIEPVKQHPERMNHYLPFIDNLNVGDLKVVPMRLSDLPQFEKLNPTISLSVLGLEEKTGKFYPLHSPAHVRNKHVSLLYLTDTDDSGAVYGHFCLIRDLHSFLGHLTKDRRRKWFCYYCLCRFSKEDIWVDHMKLCSVHGSQKVSYAEFGQNKSFDHTMYKRMVRPYHRIYYSFECVLREVATSDPRRAAGGGALRKYQHVPIAYCLLATDHNGDLAYGPVVHADPHDAASHFVSALLRLESELFELRHQVPIQFTEAQLDEYENATHCWLCGEFVPEGAGAADHCHLSGSYLGYSHANPCNTQRKTPKYTPCISHESSRFDIHAIFRVLSDQSSQDAGEISNIFVVPTARDKYKGVDMKLKVGRSLRLLDSHHFFPSDLVELAESLRDPTDLALLRNVQAGDQFKVDLMRSGVHYFPDMYGSFGELESTTSLPARGHFRSACGRGMPSVEEYEKFHDMWRVFGCQTMIDFLRVKLLSNTIALASFFNRFCSEVYQEVMLEPTQFYSLSGLAWTKMLKRTRVKLELIRDPTMYNYYERQTRGGVAHISHKFAQARLKGTESYDPDLPEAHIIALDVNQLYPHCMLEKLPCRDFRWAKAGELERLDWSTFDFDGNVGYTVMADLEIPESLKDFFDDFPPLPEHVAVPRDWLSAEQRRAANIAQLLTQGTKKKLISHLGPRNGYIIHGKSLAHLIKLGVRVTCFHVGVCYTQEAFMRDYVLELIERRRQAVHSYERKAAKLEAVSVYGYSLRSPRKNKSIKIMMNAGQNEKQRKLQQKQFKKKIGSPFFVGFTIFGPEMLAMEMREKNIRLLEPCYLGPTILDLSKTLMLQHYIAYKTTFPDSRLCMTDTDSFVFLLITDDLYAGLNKLRHIMDFSTLDPNHPLYSVENRMKSGLLKVEYGKCRISHFVGLKSKCYSMMMTDQRAYPVVVRKCSGMNGVAIQELDWNDYKQALHEELFKMVVCNQVRTDGSHNVFTVQQQRHALSSYCDKRYLLSDGVTTRAYRPEIGADFDQSLIQALARLMDENCSDGPGE